MIDELSNDYQDLKDKIAERWNGFDTAQKYALKAILDQARAVIDRRKTNDRRVV